MNYENGKLATKKSVEFIVKARKWGISIISFLLGMGLFMSEIQRLQKINLHIINYAYLTLFALTGLLIFFWIWATEKEIHLLTKWLDPLEWEPPSSIKETLMIIVVAFFLVGLLFASRDPFYYGLIFSIYGFGIIFTTKHLNNELIEAFEKSKERLKKDLKDKKIIQQKASIYLKAVESLELYCIGRPHFIRHLLIFLSGLMGLGFSIFWKISGSFFLGIGAYVIYFLTIVISEIVIHRWRNARDKYLRPLSAKLEELKRLD